ncbi:dihydrofolate reductase [Daktulosphaira vitifoliae]|uniref:dihydrofolate reductase n=1 Tax=Daktulosphaira vitifoliae TaxID=58002 RepID=UPI0021A9EA0B|nr:dihydrofolate reductase [Daktulosphaira vitifoliae]XP_050521688.1 dihydrofolate reductase [Daktulosphaira vitifoliae]
MVYNVIAAISKNGGIGYKGDLPWRLKNEMNYFNKMTTQVKSTDKKNAVIMGRLTWQSIPDKFRPLKDRLNVVISKTLHSVPEGVLLYPELYKAVEDLSLKENIEKIWVIGGSFLYNEAIKDENCKNLYITKIDQEFTCDTFFPTIDPKLFIEIDDPEVSKGNMNENGITYEFKVYKRK